MRMADLKEPVVFSHVVESLFKLVKKERLNAEQRKRLKAIGIDLDQPFLVAYSLPTWFGAVGVCAEVLFPDVPLEEAHYRIGQELVSTFGRTTIGRAVFVFLRMLGWEHSLSRITRGLQSGTNFLTASTRYLPDGSLEVSFDVLPEFHAALGSQSGIDPHFMNGNMDTMMALVGAPFRGGVLQPRAPSAQQAVYILPRKSAP
jgi:uncharacterized protein (TIGR02265 family)